MELYFNFEKLKEILASTQALELPYFEAEFVFCTDASGFALGAVLPNE